MFLAAFRSGDDLIDDLELDSSTSSTPFVETIVSSLGYTLNRVFECSFSPFLSDKAGTSLSARIGIGGLAQKAKEVEEMGNLVKLQRHRPTADLPNAAG